MTIYCRKCGEEICKHGGCWCEGSICRICTRKRELAIEAEREFNFQRDVIGPMFGFTSEGEKP
jgi:hypothetical protein